jgi:hypothetical protein
MNVSLFLIWCIDCFHFYEHFKTFCEAFVVEFHIKDDVHSCAHAQTLFTFELLYIFVKYDIVTEYLTLFWFAILVNDYKLFVSIQKSSKCLYLGVPLCYEQNWCTERSGPIIFKLKLILITYNNIRSIYMVGKLIIL